MRRPLSALLPTLTLSLALCLLVLHLITPSLADSSPHLMPTHTMHDYSHTYTGAEHPSNLPSVKIEVRSPSEIEREREQDNLDYAKLQQEHRLDSEGNVRPPGATSSSQQQSSSAPSSFTPPYTPEVSSFLEQASSTLNSVLQHDSRAIFHFKRLVARAKSALEERQFDHAATLFKEAADMYFTELRAPYAKIASSTALGETIEQRLAEKLERERADGTGQSGSVAGPNTASQQFRKTELENQPHVHTALLEYQKSLKQAGNGRVEKQAAKAQEKAATAATQKQPGKRR